MKRDDYPFFDSSLTVDERVQDLLDRLSLREKFQLMTGHHIWWTHPIKRLNIPKFGMSDGPRGISWHSSYKKNTQFPIPKCFAASWDRNLAKMYGETVADEVRARKKHVLLAPGFNIDRTPLNGRTFEYISEDPYFIREMIVPFTHGVQSKRIGVCLKHYVANNQETNRKFYSAEIDERTLREIYVKAFEQIIKEADPWSIMACYNRINGVYGCENKSLLWDLLINEFNFSGFIMSDWYATKFIQTPEGCVNAGLSLEMPNKIVYTTKKLQKSYDAGLFTDTQIDELIKRLLRIMVLTGVFDKDLPAGEVNTAKNQEVARKIAEGGIVLLKNENNVLPFNSSQMQSILVVGANANKKIGKILYGGSAAVVPPFEITVLEGLRRKYGSKIDFITDVEKASECDAIVVVTGLNHDLNMDAESADRLQLELPKEEEQLINAMATKNTKTIVVLLNGSPIAMENWISNIQGIIEGWYSGMLGGDVIADVIFGHINPSGKLPISFPKKLQDSPAHQSERSYPGLGKIIQENMMLDVFKPKKKSLDLSENKVYYDEGIYVGYRYFESKQVQPLFAFGFGLSYTQFKYEKVSLKKAEITADEEFSIEVEISNIGDKDGAEVIQVYAHDDEASVDRPEKELIGFEKIWLKSGETKIILINLRASDLAFFDIISHDWKVESGKFKLLIGSSSRDIRLETSIQVL